MPLPTPNQVSFWSPQPPCHGKVSPLTGSDARIPGWYFLLLQVDFSFKNCAQSFFWFCLMRITTSKRLVGASVITQLSRRILFSKYIFNVMRPYLSTSADLSIAKQCPLFSLSGCWTTVIAQPEEARTGHKFTMGIKNSCGILFASSSNTQLHCRRPQEF